MNRESIEKKVLGCLLGGLIGDAMGAPVENWHYERIVSEKGYINDFKGSGTDDSAIKLILCDALIKNNGYVTADEFAASFLRHNYYYDLFFIPVRNMFHKIQDELELPVHAGYGNMPSSSSAMAISPMGIINACDPRMAAAEAYEVAGLIHSGSSSFCRDGASAIAAAVAEAFDPSATVESVLNAAVAYLHPQSAGIMRECIGKTLALAREKKDYIVFRKAYYEDMKLYNTICDSRETVPVALALFYLAHGDSTRTIEYGTNFGRDADTIGTMAGAIAGAFTGIDSFNKEWVKKVLSGGSDQGKLANQMTDLIIKRYNDKKSVLKKIETV